MATATPPRGPPKPEAGLAEWASKIKAMQRQVDEDEEAEQRKLQEEIAASRMKRMRRSQMYGDSRPTSVDGAIPGGPSSPSGRDDFGDDALSNAVKNKNQDDALRKLMGDSSLQKSSAASNALSGAPAAASHAVSPASRTKPEPVSLAAFIGGKATGPRLNRHAPQQDAHDPTQFEQRTTISAPHPVFGRGGVAMPGMVTKGRPVVQSDAREGDEAADPVRAAPVKTPDRERQASIPSVARRYVERVEEQIASPQKTSPSYGSRSKSRERTMSTPSGVPAASAATAASARARSKSRERTTTLPLNSSSGYQSSSPYGAAREAADRSARPVSRGENKFDTARNVRTATGLASAPSTPPSQQRTFNASNTPNYTPSTASSRPATHRHSTPPPPSTVSTSPAPSLARPVQSSPKPSPFAPQVTASPAASPAFLRPPTQKQPTPSLSRLKGRGFVQSMVRTSTELEAAVYGAAPPSPDKSKPATPAKKLPSVLERWPATPPPPSPTPASSSPAARKSMSMETPPKSPGTGRATSLAQAGYTGRTLKTAASLPRMSDAASSISGRSSKGFDSTDDSPQLGSSNTMISYIKPMKTGDDPATATSPPRPKTPHDDGRDAGLRNKRSSGALRERPVTAAPVAAASPPGKPLSHLTKERAKPPRKTKDAHHASAPEERKSESGLGIRQASAVQAQPVPKQPSFTTPSASSAVAFPRAPSPWDDSVPDVKSSPPHEARPSRITDTWADQPIIGVKTPQPHKSHENIAPVRPKPEVSEMIRRPLPGMAPVASAPVLASSPAPPNPNHERGPSTPRPRIPSTGSRATVMDVAQAFTEQEVLKAQAPLVESPTNERQEPPLVVVAAPEAPAAPEPAVAPPSPKVAAPALEKRRSSYDKYSAVALPPLKEEGTPMSSPSSTLARNTHPPQIEEEGPVDDRSSTHTSDPSGGHSLVPSSSSDLEDVVFDVPAVQRLPQVKIKKLLNAKQTKYVPDPDTATVSVDVMALKGTTTTELQKDVHIFYDMDILAVIHRCKSKSSGLVTTTLWGWFGKNSQQSEKEDGKLQALAKRYGTSMIRVEQYHEPAELVHVVGGVLAIRQGSRVHWTAENTAMHLVRSVNGSVLIDEHDLDVRNLCSGFSYCVSVLDTTYVWQGFGSTPAEQRAARSYANSLANGGTVIELREGETDNDDMFWMVLGSDEYAKADYWRWRSRHDAAQNQTSSSTADPRLWLVDTKGEETFSFLDSFPSVDTLHESVLVIDCTWEYFVVVGQDARDRRLDISLAIYTVKAMANLTASAKPFEPSVHVLVLPSQIPLDLRIGFRGIDELKINGGNVPDHMNILHYSTALQHLQKTSWVRAALKDPRMLPLGVHPSMLP